MVLGVMLESDAALAAWLPRIATVTFCQKPIKSSREKTGGPCPFIVHEGCNTARANRGKPRCFLDHAQLAGSACLRRGAIRNVDRDDIGRLGSVSRSRRTCNQ